ncbi:MAG: hypothetical protein HY906_14165 [Deltaproteobacteria bacterium]|nr:hypothetical protein [Deltaproteobacteria bacterium]
MTTVGGFLVKLLGGVSAEQREGLSLDPGARQWEIPGRVDVAVFFKALPALLPDGATLFVEGKPSARVKEFLGAHAVEATAKIERGTGWPRQVVFHVAVDRDTMNGLAELAEEHAAPELADHIVVYRDNRVLLSWYDFVDDPIYLAGEVADEQVEEFCRALAVQATRRP